MQNSRFNGTSIPSPITKTTNNIKNLTMSSILSPIKGDTSFLSSTKLITPTRSPRYALSRPAVESTPVNKNGSHHDVSANATKYNSTLGVYKPTKATNGTVINYKENRESNVPTHQAKYGVPGLFPVIHFYPKQIPVLTPRPNQAVMKLSSTGYKTRSGDGLGQPYFQELTETSLGEVLSEPVGTKSVLDALKEISRKRIHGDSFENESSPRRSNDFGSNKRVREDDSSPRSQNSPSMPNTKRICVVDPVFASNTSSETLIQNKRKAIFIDDGFPINLKPSKKVASVETQTIEVVSAAPKPQVEKKDANCQKSDDESNAQEKQGNGEPTNSTSKESVPREESIGQKLRLLGENIHSIQKKNKLAKVLSTLTGEEPVLLSLKPKNADFADTLKSPISIMSPRDKAKHDKHVHFADSNVDAISKNDTETVDLINLVSSSSNTTTDCTSNATSVPSAPSFSMVTPLNTTATVVDLTSSTPPVEVSKSKSKLEVEQPINSGNSVVSTATTSTATATMFSFGSPKAQNVLNNLTATTSANTSSVSAPVAAVKSFSFGVPKQSSTESKSTVPTITNTPPKSVVGGFKFTVASTPLSSKTTTVEAATKNSTFPTLALGSPATAFGDGSKNKATASSTPATSSNVMTFGNSNLTVVNTSANTFSGFGSSNQTSNLPSTSIFGSGNEATKSSNGTAAFGNSASFTLDATKTINSFSSPAAATTTASMFGASPSGNTTTASGFPIFGTPTSQTTSTFSSSNNSLNFGTSTSSAAGPSSLFSNTVVNAVPAFGNSTSTTSTPTFGATSTTVPAFGVVTTTTAATVPTFGAASPAFGTGNSTTFGTGRIGDNMGFKSTTTASFGITTTNATTTAAPSFGGAFTGAAKSNVGSTLFGGGGGGSNVPATTTSSFGFGMGAGSSTTANTSSTFGGFGGSAASSGFGTNAAVGFGGGSTFGATVTATTTAPTFGMISPPAFGSASSTATGTAGAFGTTAPPAFGSSTAVTTASNTFTFGAANNNSFGFNAAPTTTTPSFGSTNKAATGSVFTFGGAPTTTVSSGFGFGAAANTAPAFGTSNTPSAFGAGVNNTSSAFGSTNNVQPVAPFGSTSTQFGAASNVTPVKPMQNGFGASAAVPAFGSSQFNAATPQSTTFGSSFGSANNNATTGFGNSAIPTFGANASNGNANGNAFGSFGGAAPSTTFQFNAAQNNSAPSMGQPGGAIFAFGASDPKPSGTFNFSAPSANGPAFGVGAPQQTPNLFSIGTGGTPTRPGRTHIKAKRRT